MRVIYHELKFLRPAGTSRGYLNSKPSYFLFQEDQWGECSLIPGLSPDDQTQLSAHLDRVSRTQAASSLSSEYPSLQFAKEMLRLGIQDNDFTRGAQSLAINGLLWMGDKDYILEQVRTLLDQGFRCLKMKVGSLDFATELEILRTIRSLASEESLQLRVDANGAFEPLEALQKLNQLSQYDLHSIEQPIKPRNEEMLQELCRSSPIPIALDEELIDRRDQSKIEFLEAIQPQYLVLKPSLLGGLQEADEWIEAAIGNDIGWWATSALESNIGLFHIAQWLSLKAIPDGMYQGLGTGKLFSNNIPSPLRLEGDQLSYTPDQIWDFSVLPDR